ncbi:MAG: signal peptidase II [Candidatus Babeliales bacterium]
MIFIYGSIALIFLALDRCTKYWALIHCTDYTSFNRFFSCSLCFNKGIAGGILHSENSLLALAITLSIALILILACFYTLFEWYKNNVYLFGELLVISGAVSNLYDRIMYPGVIDFIIIHFRNFYFPAFNIADIGIIIGIGIVFYKSCYDTTHAQKA